MDVVEGELVGWMREFHGQRRAQGILEMMVGLLRIVGVTAVVLSVLLLLLHQLVDAEYEEEEMSIQGVV